MTPLQISSSLQNLGPVVYITVSIKRVPHLHKNKNISKKIPTLKSHLKTLFFTIKKFTFKKALNNVKEA